ncbi:uncharacterized protein PAC_03847 [Phialocephala subalpina]|uniref:SWIM-type domain-containing protein n=1 Tax=Phialocephala subalpina TaxID=576137 RepID=A0A1L7WMF4_9HELO|nr:uncharacterized protein PAC_03847 [Phialocephala subalpina]
MTPLPTPRTLLTSLIDTVTSTLPTPSQQQVNEPYSAPDNPLKNLPTSHRALLTTLHVLFPPPMLLQALDLLDRGLVTRLIFPPSHSSQSPQNCHGDDGSKGKAPEVYPPQAHIHLPDLPASATSSPTSEDIERIENEKRRGMKMYLVRSSQPTKGRYAAGIGTVYHVHVESWNCSCAAFAFAAFPASSYNVPWNLEQDSRQDYEMGMEEEKEEEEWEFGGLSRDGKDGGDGGGVPVCKHLLACVLGERWSEVLGSYVKEKVVSREEMAGYGAE